MTDRTERDDDPDASDGLRPSWSRSSRPFPRNVMQPLQAFLQTESSSAILVLTAAALALVWANAPFGDSYGRFWGTELTIRIGARALTDDPSYGLGELSIHAAGLGLRGRRLNREVRRQLGGRRGGGLRATHRDLGIALPIDRNALSGLVRSSHDAGHGARQRYDDDETRSTGVHPIGLP